MKKLNNHGLGLLEIFGVIWIASFAINVIAELAK